MPITIEIAGPSVSAGIFDKVFQYFDDIDRKFSTYKEDSEITRINNGEIKEADYSDDVKTIFKLSDQTKEETGGYFDIVTPAGKVDPSGLVKGWSIWNAADLLQKDGFLNFYVDAGGDIEARGRNDEGEKWAIGIRNPFNEREIIKVIRLSNGGVATSGTYVRGGHIYNPKNGKLADEIVSLTVVGPNVYEADRFATAAFAMGKKGIDFIEDLEGLEGYMIDKNGTATMTSDFDKYTDKNV